MPNWVGVVSALSLVIIALAALVAAAAIIAAALGVRAGIKALRRCCWRARWLGRVRCIRRDIPARPMPPTQRYPRG